ncbi:MAG: P-loop NTPase [Elusimicrobiota bacterium]
MKKIAVASGKGGTGKTTVSILLTRLLSQEYKVQLLDCDVENPDCHLFFAGKAESSREVKVFYPIIDKNKCTFCGKCQKVCEYNCLLVMKDNVMFFKELCHPCRGCLVVCPEGAISEGLRRVGDIFSYACRENIYFNYAVMDTGEARANPLIEKLKEKIRNDADFVIFDSPPGANCPMVETVKGSDYVVLVTEPTPFGLYDLEIAWSVVSKLDIPCGIVINRSEGKDAIIEDFAKREDLKIMFKIPFSREFASYYSKGIIKEKFFPGIENDVISKFKNPGQIITGECK